MKKGAFLSVDFLKQFKSGEELNSFFIEIQRHGVEQPLKGELDALSAYI